MSEWITEKYDLAADESYRDLTNLLPKLQKHMALEAEISQNKVRLNSLNEAGNQMIDDGHYAAPEIRETLGRVNEQWERLDDKAKDKGKKLREASQQELFYRALEDANAKLDEMERLISSDDVGHDLRSVRTLLNKHQVNAAEDHLGCLCSRPLGGPKAVRIQIQRYRYLVTFSQLECFCLQCFCTQCFDSVGWASGRASSL